MRPNFIAVIGIVWGGVLVARAVLGTAGAGAGLGVFFGAMLLIFGLAALFPR